MDITLQSARILHKTSVIWIALCLVFSKAQLYLQPSDESPGFFTNDQFVVTCGSSPESGATRLVWQSPSGEIKDTKGRIYVEPETEESHQSLRLVISGVRKADEGDYTCSALQDDEEIQTSLKLVVYRSITFAGTPEENTATEGDESITVLCNVKGDPEPSVNWIFNRMALKNGEKYTVTKSSLTIRNVTRADDGIYSCRAAIVAAKNSQMKSINIKLGVDYPPEWVDPEPKIVYAALNTVGSIRCEAKGHPVPKFQWLIDGEVMNSETNDLNITYFDDHSVLDLLLENRTLYADYLCRVSNPLGTLEQTLTLKEGDRPDVPEVLVQGTEQDSLFLKLNEQGYNPLKITGYVVQYKSNVNKDWDSAKMLDFELGDPFVIKNLKKDTNYIIRVAAKNTVGVGEFSQEINHQTDPELRSTVRDQETQSTSSVNGAFALFSVYSFHWSTFVAVSLLVVVS